MLTNVYCLFLLDCLLLALRLCRSVASFLIPKGICRVATFLVELGASAIVALLLDNEVRGSVQVCICCGSGVQSRSWVIHILSILEGVGIFTDVEEKLLAIMVLLRPLSNIVRGFLLLKPLEDDLVLTCDLHELSLPGLSVKTFSVGKRWSAGCELGPGHRFLLSHRLLWILLILQQ